jgi:hypothetical protein
MSGADFWVARRRQPFSRLKGTQNDTSLDGFIRFSLVTIPVQAFTTAYPDGSKIHLNQLHDKCHNPSTYAVYGMLREIHRFWAGQQFSKSRSFDGAV